MFLFQECCDCCLLAKDLVDKEEPCEAPVGFSAYCLKSFNQCCQQTSTAVQNLGGVFKDYSSSLLFSVPSLQQDNSADSDRCKQASCDHLCTDRGDNGIECSCRPGYNLDSDGSSCIGWFC
jgi:hypothetical protein